MSPSRRKNYFIKKSFQTRFSLRFLTLIALEALLITGLFFYVAQGTLTTGYSGTELVIEKTSTFFYLSFVLIIMITAVGVGMAGMLVFILYSHRIAGPLFRFQRSLQDLSAGNLTGRIHLRRKDQLGDMAESINHTAESLDRQVGRLKKEIHACPKSGASPESVTRLKEMVDFFKTSFD